MPLEALGTLLLLHSPLDSFLEEIQVTVGETAPVTDVLIPPAK